MSCELLGTLAQCLLTNSTILEIVNSLMDIQHLNEKNLYDKRERLSQSHKEARKEVEKITETEIRRRERDALKRRQAKELQSCDFEIIAELDKKVLEQQHILVQAGVPGFKVSNDPTEIKVQMCLIDFIIRSTEIIYTSSAST